MSMRSATPIDALAQPLEQLGVVGILRRHGFAHDRLDLVKAEFAITLVCRRCRHRADGRLHIGDLQSRCSDTMKFKAQSKTNRLPRYGCWGGRGARSMSQCTPEIEWCKADASTIATL